MRQDVSVGLYCKSFRDDFPQLWNLVHSVEKFVSSDLPLYISVPRSDLNDARVFESICQRVRLIADEEYVPVTGKGVGGWVHQQLAKFSFAETGLLDIYLCIDSDTYLVRSVDRTDFFHGDSPRIVCSDAGSVINSRSVNAISEMRAGRFLMPPLIAVGEPRGFSMCLAEARNILNSAPRTVEERGLFLSSIFLESPKALVCQPGQFFHSSSLRLMLRLFEVQGFSAADTLKLIPWEYNWYGHWWLATQFYPLTPSHPPFLHFADAEGVIAASELGVDESEVAKSFWGIQMAARHHDTMFLMNSAICQQIPKSPFANE